MSGFCRRTFATPTFFLQHIGFACIFDYSKFMTSDTKTAADRAYLGGWRLPVNSRSLPEVHGSIAVPTGAGFWRKLFAFAGPGYLVAVGYMDPGNWATDLAGGARYGYTLLSVIMISNLMAILLQALAARLGLGSGRDLAQ